jgi:WD40 repeat protein
MGDVVMRRTTLIGRCAGLLGALALAPWVQADPAAAGAARPVLVAEVGHADRVGAVAVSRDGRYVLTGSDDRTARLWQADTGKEVRRFEGHAGAVTAVAFSSDGRRIVTGSSDGTGRVWTASTGEVVTTLRGHAGRVSAVAFSPDDAYVLTGSHDGTAVVTHLATGERVTCKGHKELVSSVAFSPDGTQVLTGAMDATARLWEARTGRLVQEFTGHTKGVTSVAFAPIGTHVLTGSGDKTARLWHNRSGQTVQTYSGHTAWVQSVAFSPDGRQVLTGADDRTARLHDARSGAFLAAFTGHAADVTSVAFGPDGRHVFTASADRTARRWAIATQATVETYEGHAHDILSVAFSADGRHILTGSTEGAALRWDLHAGQNPIRFTGHGGTIASVAFSPDGTLVLTGAEDTTARIWSSATAECTQKLIGHQGCVCCALFSPDGAYVLTASKDQSARLWNAATGNLVMRFDKHTLSVNAAAFSPDGTQVLTGSGDETARLWATQTGAEVRVFRGHADRIEAVAFSPDGRKVLTGSRDRTARLEAIDGTGEPLVLKGHRGCVSAVAFTAGGEEILTGSWDGTVRLWRTATGELLREFTGHTSRVTSLALSPDGTHLVTGSLDGTARVWDPATGRTLCSLMSFRDGSWAVTDPQGRFDASHAGDVRGLHWVVGMEVISLDQLKARYYEPGLLAKLLGANDEPLRKVEAFTAPRLYPDVRVEQDKGKLRIQLDDLGGGIGEVVILVNGKERTADARGARADPAASHLTIEEDLSDDPRLRPGETNTIEVFARNAEGYLRSRGVVTAYEAEGDEETEAPALHAVIAGVSDYRGSALDLRFAAADAKAFALALRLGSERLLGAANTHITLLENASRETLVQALTEARRARPGDVLVVYLAGHGVNVGEAFYYLTADAASADLTDPAVRSSTALSHDELITAINAIPALKQVLILDTCASGSVIDALVAKRAVPSSQVRALERIKDRTGMFVLAGCAGNRVSYEDARFGQGLLTYSLLLGMKGVASGGDGTVEVAPLCQFAADRVRQLAADIGSVQEPSVAAPRGGTSFPIGYLREEDTAAIQLKATRPVFVRTRLFDPDEGADVLDLSLRVDGALQDEAARGPGAAFWFVDRAAYDGGLEITGSYGTTDGVTKARIRLRRDGAFVTPMIELEGPAEDLPQRIADEARRSVLALVR